MYIKNEYIYKRRHIVQATQSSNLEKEVVSLKLVKEIYIMTNIPCLPKIEALASNYRIT